MSNNNAQIKESLSALMDGQADELEVRRVLKEISENDELRDTWRRHQMAAAAMRRELPEQVVDYSVAIRAAIEDEQSHGAPAMVHRSFCCCRICCSSGINWCTAIQPASIFASTFSDR